MPYHVRRFLFQARKSRGARLELSRRRPNGPAVATITANKLLYNGKDYAYQIETLAKLKEGDTIKLGLSFGVRSYTDKEEKIRYNQSVSGWGVEVVELSSL